MKEFVDIKHDCDSCKDVWEEFYKIVYYNFFGKYFDFTKIEDKETSSNCKRWYIKLKKELPIKKEFSKFKMAGDCIFNFNDKKVKILEKYIINSDEGKKLLKECHEKHHSFENFAFMPITGGMNNSKGRQRLDRPDIHINEIKKYFDDKNSCIFSNARQNKEALKWYLSIYNKGIYKYIHEVFFIDDKKFIDEEFLAFASKKVEDETSAIQYMKLAKKFWNLREQSEIFNKIKNNKVNYK